MSNDLSVALDWTIKTSEQLLNETTLTDLQRKFMVCIADEARALQGMIVALEGLPLEHIQHTLSFEGRSQLANIIGYSEVLLEEEDGALSDYQRESLDAIQANGRELLNWLNELAG